MLVALTSVNERKVSFETSKSEGPFYCPCCKKEVGLKKGDKKIHHFYHIKENPECTVPKESEIHLRIKKEMYEHFTKLRNCRKCELERNLKGVRPDISLYIDDTAVAIEIQKSDISCDLIRQRMIRYSQLNIYVLWVIPELLLKKKSNYYGASREYHNFKDWEKFLHKMYNGRLYYWNGGTNVDAVHFTPESLFHDGDEYGDSYFYPARKRMLLDIQEKTLCIEDNFTYSMSKPGRIRLSYGYEEIPKCRIFMDTKPDWWDNDA